MCVCSLQTAPQCCCCCCWQPGWRQTDRRHLWHWSRNRRKKERGEEERKWRRKDRQTDWPSGKDGEEKSIQCKLEREKERERGENRPSGFHRPQVMSGFLHHLPLMISSLRLFIYQFCAFLAFNFHLLSFENLSTESEFRQVTRIPLRR